MDNSERVNINQKSHIIEKKEKNINIYYSHQNNIQSTNSIIYKNTAVQYKKSHHIVKTIHNNKYHSSQRTHNSTMTYNNASRNNPIVRIDNNKENMAKKSDITNK